MVWQSYEYQSVALLDEPLVEQLVDYLEGKESQLSRKIIETIRLLEGIPSLSEPEANPTMRLHEAIEEFRVNCLRRNRKLSSTINGGKSLIRLMKACGVMSKSWKAQSKNCSNKLTKSVLNIGMSMSCVRQLPSKMN